METLFSPGSIFLWMFWPSFNSVLVDAHTPGRKLDAVCSTYLALAVSAVTAAALSVLSSPKGKVNLVWYDTWYVKSWLSPFAESLFAGVKGLSPVYVKFESINTLTTSEIYLYSSLRSICTHASLPAELLLGFPFQGFINLGKPWQLDSLLLSYQPLASDISRFRSPHARLPCWLNNLFITISHKLLFSRTTCCVRFNATTPVLSWAHMDSLVYWDG